jgi:hypothetical protein
MGDPNIIEGVLTPQDIFNLKVDTQSRWDKINSYSNNFDLPDTFPNYGGNPLNKDNQISLYEGIFSDNPQIKDTAKGMINQQISEDPHVKYMSGFKIDTPYPEARKYVDRGYGFDPTRDNEDFYYKNEFKNKTLAGRVIETGYKGVGRLLSTAVTKLFQGVGYVGSMLVNSIPEIGDIVTGKNDNNWLETVADNGFSKWFQDLENDIKDKWMPVFKPSGWDNKGFFEKLGYGGFWSDEVSDGLAFMASAIIPGTAIGKIGSGVSILGKAATVANTARNTIQAGLGLETLGDLGAVAYNIASESAFEANDAYTTLKQQLRKDRQMGLNSLSEQEIEGRAGDAASRVFKANLGILSFSSLFENKFFYKPIVKRLQGTSIVGSGIQKGLARYTVEDNLEATIKDKSKNWFSRNFLGKMSDGAYNKYAKIPFYGKRAIEGIAIEGFWEENAQNAAQRWASKTSYFGSDGKERTPDDNFFDQLFNQTADTIAGKDPQNATSVGLGGLIALVGGTGIAKAFGGNSFMQGERRAVLSKEREAIENYNNARHNALSWNDIFEKNEDGTVKYDNNQPVVNSAKLAQKVAALNDYGFKSLTIDKIQDAILREKLKKDLYAEYLGAAVRAGIQKQVLHKLENLTNVSDNILKDMGLDKESLKDIDLPSLISNSNELVNKYTEIFSQAPSRQKGVSEEKHEEKDLQRKYNAYLSYSRLLSSSQAKDKFEAANLERISQQRQSAFSPDTKVYDSQVHQYNSLTFEERALNDLSNVYKDNGSDFMRKDIKNRIKEIKGKKDEIGKFLEDYKISPDDNGLIILDKKYKLYDIASKQFYTDLPTFLEDQSHAKKAAELGVDIFNNQTLYDKLIDKNKGLDNYDDYLDYLASIKQKDDKADVEEETQPQEEPKPEEQKPEEPTPIPPIVTQPIATTPEENEVDMIPESGDKERNCT